MSRASRVALALQLLLVATLVAVAWPWPLGGDSAVLRYATWLHVAHGYVPYAEISTLNMPGVLWLDALLEVLPGSGDRAFRAFDLLWALVGAVLVAILVRRSGRVAAAMGGALVLALHLSGGADLVLQRDVLLTPLVLGVLLALQEEIRGRYALSGLLLGLATLVKPTAVVFAAIPAVRALQARHRGLAAPRLAALAGAALLPWIVAAGWLLSLGALDDFLWVLTVELPAHGGAGSHGLAPEIVRAPLFLAVMGALVLWLVWRIRRDRHFLLLGGALVAFLHLAVQGKYLGYHFYPALVLLVALGTRVAAERLPRAAPWLLLAGAVLAGARIPAMAAVREAYLGFRPPDCPALTAELEAVFGPGDRVQPVSQSLDAQCAVQRAGLVPASPVVWDTQLLCYPPPLRRRFQERLLAHAGEPDGLVVATWNLCQVGPDRLPEVFPELAAMLATDYRLALEVPGHRVYVREEARR